MSELNGLISLVTQYGVTTAIALYLVYWITKRLQNDLHSIEQLLREIKDILKEG